MNVLHAGWVKWGHWLDKKAADDNLNLVISAVARAARHRDASGKGVGDRTFYNMLSSQAMCFNIFGPLAEDTELAGRVLSSFIPELIKVNAVHIEYTPEPSIFRDQTGRGGVDCDVLIEGIYRDSGKAVIVIETKFVEPEFSRCGFCKPGRAKKNQPVCSDDIVLKPPYQNCLYASRKNYGYWERVMETGTLNPKSIPETGCPFSGPLWQLWVNHTLAAAEARARHAEHYAFGVLAPEHNNVLLRNGEVLDRFRGYLSQPETLFYIPLDRLLDAIRENSGGQPGYGIWSAGLDIRYGGI